MNHSASLIIQKALQDAALVGDYDAVSWPSFISSAPDGESTPDNIVSFYDTEGLELGRRLDGGAYSDRNGVQLRARAVAYQDGWDKMTAIQSFLDSLHRLTVSIGTDTYMIHTSTRTSPLLPIGNEDNTKRRFLFTLNILLTITIET